MSANFAVLFLYKPRVLQHSQRLPLVTTFADKLTIVITHNTYSHTRDAHKSETEARRT